MWSLMPVEEVLEGGRHVLHPLVELDQEIAFSRSIFHRRKPPAQHFQLIAIDLPLAKIFCSSCRSSA